MPGRGTYEYHRLPQVGDSGDSPTDGDIMAETKEPSVDHDDAIQVNLEDSVIERLAEQDSKFALLSSEAKSATNAEHAMTIRQAIQRYPKAVAWSVFFSTAVAMEGYDLVLVSGFYAFPEFVETFGKKSAKGKYQIPAAWQAGLSNGARAGEILGLLINGIVCEWLGFKKTMIGTLILLTALIFIPVFAQNIETLEVAEILMGIPWGVFQTLTTTYAAEVCPVALRGYLTTYVNMMWGVGQLIASGVLRAMLSRHGQWAWRIPFALQWMWPIPLIVGIAFAPESPWWLVRKGRNEDARRSLRWLTSDATDGSLDDTVSMMRHTNELEKEISAGTSYLDCFRGVNLRRTEITCITWVMQAASGASLMGYAAYFFEQAGLPTTISFDFSITLYVVAIIGVVISWFVMTHVGRRTIFLCGLSAQCTVLLIIGCLSFSKTNAGSYAIGSFLLLFTLCYDIGIGTVAYSVVSEISSNRLRTKTVVLARSLYNCQGLVNGVITPYMLNPTAWGWEAKAGFFWAGLALICLIWTFFRLPEPKGRTYGELDVLFEQKIPARKFRKAHVDPFRVQEMTVDGTVTGISG